MVSCGLDLSFLLNKYTESTVVVELSQTQLYLFFHIFFLVSHKVIHLFKTIYCSKSVYLIFSISYKVANVSPSTPLSRWNRLNIFFLFSCDIIRHTSYRNGFIIKRTHMETHTDANTLNKKVIL